MIDLSFLTEGLTFFRQKRLDGGIRTGIMLGGITVLGHYEEGEGDYDPSLIWSVDLRCNGKGLPNSAEGARQWLLSHESTIKDGLTKYAEYLSAGSDPTGAYLLEWDRFPKLDEDVSTKLVWGAMRRIDALALAQVVQDVADRWRDLVLSLSPGEPVVA